MFLNKNIFLFFASGLLFPSALLLFKILKINRKVKDNHLQALRLRLNFTQLLFFHFLIFVLIKIHNYFIMTYAIITSANFFP